MPLPTPTMKRIVPPSLSPHTHTRARLRAPRRRFGVQFRLTLPTGRVVAYVALVQPPEWRLAIPAARPTDRLVTEIDPIDAFRDLTPTETAHCHHSPPF